MYTPKSNQVSDRAILIEAMRTYSFAILFGAQPGEEAGAAVATHLPVVVRDEGAHGLIEGHFALANPHWHALAGREALVVFPGPHCYVSPKLYVETLSVPTWNYIAIHAYGIVELVEDESGKDALLAGLIDAHEPAYAERWREMPGGFRCSMLAGVVGFRIPISRIEGKFKLSQNRAEADRRNIYSAHARGDPDQQALAMWMARLTGESPEPA
jgi:transcriptional regulator